MSVFKVALANVNQGAMDLNPATGAAMSPSIQRTIYVTGPNNTHRKLKDGDQFTDCNYWKRFAYPQVSLADAFIQVVTDDGSTYSDTEENTYPLVYDFVVTNGSTYTDFVADIATDTGGYAVFVQIHNQGGTAVKVRLNGAATAIFDLAANETQVFNSGDLQISKVEIANTVSGGSTSNVQVLVAAKSVCNS